MAKKPKFDDRILDKTEKFVAEDRKRLEAEWKKAQEKKKGEKKPRK